MLQASTAPITAAAYAPGQDANATKDDREHWNQDLELKIMDQQESARSRPLDLKQLSRTISLALRHEPWRFELELDDDGAVPVEVLLDALRSEKRIWADVGEADIVRMMAEADKQRYELSNGRIRALYGHSTPQRLAKEPAAPPALLYHGTSPKAAAAIRAEGLKPMGRQYVHLSVEPGMADQVGRRKAGAPVILAIRAGEAHRAGTVFYRGNELVWLADQVSPAFID